MLIHRRVTPSSRGAGGGVLRISSKNVTFSFVGFFWDENLASIDLSRDLFRYSKQSEDLW